MYGHIRCCGYDMVPFRTSLAFVSTAALALTIVACSSTATGAGEPGPASGVDEATPEAPGSAPATGAPTQAPTDVPTTATPPSSPPASVPSSAPPACTGMGGTTASPVLIVKPLGIELQNAVAPLVLGAGYRTNAPADTHPLERISGTVASGAPLLDGSASGTGRSSASVNFTTSVSSADLAAIVPATQQGTLYRARTNGTDPPHAWTEVLATDATSVLGKTGARTLAIYRAARVDLARTASLGTTERQGADWGIGELTDFVRFAHYSRYFAYTVQIRFDSDCKRDTFMFKAGGSGLDALLPTQDNRGLGQYLVDAKATIVVGVITLGQAAATKAVLDATTCATNALPACRALVNKLNDLVSNVGTAALPTVFNGSASGNNDWFFDSFTHSPKGFLLPQ